MPEGYSSIWGDKRSPAPAPPPVVVHKPCGHCDGDGTTGCPPYHRTCRLCRGTGREHAQCPTCGGAGRQTMNVECPRCAGTGRVPA